MHASRHVGQLRFHSGRSRLIIPRYKNPLEFSCGSPGRTFNRLWFESERLKLMSISSTLLQEADFSSWKMSPNTCTTKFIVFLNNGNNKWLSTIRLRLIAEERNFYLANSISNSPESRTTIRKSVGQTCGKLKKVSRGASWIKSWTGKRSGIENSRQNLWHGINKDRLANFLIAKLCKTYFKFVFQLEHKVFQCFMAV